MITAFLAWLRAHKQFALVAGAILAVFTSGYCAGKRSVSQPAVHEVAQAHATATVNSQVDTTAHAGPWTVKTWEYGPSVDHVSAPVVGTCAPVTRRRVVVAQDRVPTAAGADRAGEEGQQDAEHGDSVPPGQLIRYTEEEHGATTTETHAQAEVHEESTRKLDLTVSPAMLARSLALGVEDPFGDKKLHIEGGVMVTQHVGVRLGWTPANGLLKGLTPMAEVRF